MNIKAIEKRIAKMQEDIGDERDKLDDFIAEIEELKETCEQAWDALQEARDALSQFV